MSGGWNLQLSEAIGANVRPMQQKEVFALALGLARTPWKVVDIRFDEALKRLDIDLDFPPGSRFPHQGAPMPVRKLRNRVRTAPECCPDQIGIGVRMRPEYAAGVKRVSVPWSGPYGHFTLLMESLVRVPAQNGMTVAGMARTLGEHAKRIWGIVRHPVLEAHDRMDLGEERVIRVDE